MKVSIELQPCLKNRSGVGTYCYELTKRLRNDTKLQFQGNVFNFCGRNDNREIYKEFPCEIHENRVIPYSAFRLCQYLLPIPYSRLFGNTDVNLFFNYIVPEGVSGKVLTTIHDVSFLRFPETLKKRNLLRLNSGLKKSIRRADRIITISEFSKREIVELLNVPEEKISIVPCAALEKDSSMNFDDLSEKHGIDEPYLLFVGTIEPRKNIVRLLEAFDLLKKEIRLRHKLILAGGSGWQNDEIYQTLNRMENKNDVIITGFVTEEEKTALYENAECLVFPSLYEGFGIPPLEAMQYGCPVICSNAASLPEIAGNAAEYVDPCDPEKIAEGIWNVLSDHTLRDQLTGNGYERTKLFSWDRSADKLKKICKEEA